MKLKPQLKTPEVALLSAAFTTKNPGNTEYVFTIAEVADRLGISRNTVSHIERKALKKLRHGLEQAGFTLSDFV